MSVSDDFSLSIPGTPARFAVDGVALDTVVSHTITPVGGGDTRTAIVQGVDYWCSTTGGTVAGWITVGFLHQQWVGAAILDPASKPYETFQWRGYLPLQSGESVEFGIETGLPTTMGFMAWGIIVPAFWEI